MGIFSDFKRFRNNTKDLKSVLEFNKRMYMGQDPFTGKPNLTTNTKERIKNLQNKFNTEKIETPIVENIQTVLYKIRELEYKLNNDRSLSTEKKAIMKKHLELLYEKYEELSDIEKNDYSSTTEDIR